MTNTDDEIRDQATSQIETLLGEGRRTETPSSQSSLIAAAVAATPGSAQWELELCRREYNTAGQRVREAQASLDAAVQELIYSAMRYGRADEAVRHGGYGPEPGLSAEGTT